MVEPNWQEGWPCIVTGCFALCAKFSHTILASLRVAVWTGNTGFVCGCVCGVFELECESVRCQAVGTRLGGWLIWQLLIWLSSGVGLKGMWCMQHHGRCRPIGAPYSAFAWGGVQMCRCGLHCMNQTLAVGTKGGGMKRPRHKGSVPAYTEIGCWCSSAGESWSLCMCMACHTCACSTWHKVWP